MSAAFEISEPSGDPASALEGVSRLPVLDPGALRDLHQHLRNSHRVDLSGHKLHLLTTQVFARMARRQLVDVGAYLELLDENGQESRALLEGLLIGSTRFFRDPAVFEELPASVLQRVLDPNTRAPLRMWVAGCSTGEEAYSLAMVAAECLERRGERRQVTIIATDLREAALRHARLGWYSHQAMEAVSEVRRQRFFVPAEGGFSVKRGLRNAVMFGRHDLLGSPPYQQLDLVSCRNLLIYLEPDAQRRALTRLHYALKQLGVLLLGASESALQGEPLFAPLDATCRLYTKKRPPPPSSASVRTRWT